MKRLWWVVSSFVAVGAIVIIGILLAPKSPVSPEIKKQLTSTLLLPRGEGIEVNSRSVKYEGKNKLLSYQVAFAGVNITVSEQPTPETFVDIPQVYVKLVESMNNYASFDVNVGTVYLTQPKDLNGKQAAVLNSKGTLLFAKSDKNLKTDEWRVFFNRLEVQN